MLEVQAIRTGVLADDQQFLGAGRDELFGLAQHRVRASAGKVAAYRRNDAEGAAVVAALGNFHIGIVTRR